MKKLGLIFIILGLLLTAISIYGIASNSILKFTQIMLVIVGLPLFNVGIALRLIQRPPATRKTPTIILLVIALSLILFGVASKFYFHIIGASIEVIVGTFTFCFAFAPLFTKFRYEKWSSYLASTKTAYLLSIADFILVVLIFNGLLFKMMYWPFGGIQIGIGLAMLPFTLVAWNRILGKQLVFRKEAEEKLGHALDELTEKSEEISDSINYAKRIQTAILPPDKLFTECLPNSFVLYKPKDVVAGDFYWIQKVGDKVYVAAADCTGHGVPGAMVSVICNSALNRAVREYNIESPAMILDKTRDIVIEEFSKSEEEVWDGMDVAVCSIVGNSLEYAGAHNPLWIVRNGELLETKADKQPVGMFEAAVPFTNHKIELQKGDIIYIFSDGYVDQFGGDKGKKFKPKNLRNLLLEISSLSMHDQKLKLDQVLEDWRGSLEQVDDICVIGVRI